jgi:transposase
LARWTKWLWADEEKLSICLQTTAPGVSVARVAQRYAMNANSIFKWLRDPRSAPEAPAEPDAACFLTVEIVDRPLHDDDSAAAGPVSAAGMIEIDTAGRHRLVGAVRSHHGRRIRVSNRTRSAPNQKVGALPFQTMPMNLGLAAHDG